MNKMDRGCNAAERELNSAFDKLIVKLQDTMKGVNFIIENFSELTNPINENGELVEGWVGDELEEVFVQPDCVTRLDTGYREENEKDRRQLFIYLTDEGKKIVLQSIEKFTDSTDQICMALGEEKTKEFIEYLDQARKVLAYYRNSK